MEAVAKVLITIQAEADLVVLVAVAEALAIMADLSYREQAIQHTPVLAAV